MKKFLAAIGTGLAFFGFILASFAIQTASVSAAPPSSNGLPNCADDRHNFEGKFLDPAKSPNSEILCVCSATASGCPSVTVQTCQSRPYGRLKTISPGLQVCVYTFGQVNHPAWQNTGQKPAYWAQRITGPLGNGVLPNCADARHNYQGVFLDPSKSPQAEILCVCAPNASGCPAIDRKTCRSRAYYRITKLPTGEKVCVYTFGQVNHPGWQNDGRLRAYWAQRLVGRDN